MYVLPNSIDFAMFDVLWEYELKLGHWARYKHELSDKLNQASTSLIIKAELEESELNIDLSIMKQVNMVSGFRRNIRCAVKKKEDEKFVVWEYQKGRRYYPLPRDISVQLEATQAAFKILSLFNCKMPHSSGLDGIELQFEGLRWSVNIVEMKMTSTNGQKYKFRRTESHAESAISASPVPPAQRTRTVIKRGPKSVEYKEIKSDKEDEDWEISSKKSCHQKKSNYDKCTKGNTKSRSYKSGKRTVIIKGSVPVDPECVEKLKTAHVLSEGNIAWDVMLNQVN
uniref:WWE domain-containing protein n=1 Tax=Heterorhabditis bacteriophora TaxID=37862 RepID=A0A1I7XG89_HETBA